MLNHSTYDTPNEESEIQRLCVYVETDHDTDGDGKADLAKACLQIPRVLNDLWGSLSTLGYKLPQRSFETRAGMVLARSGTPWARAGALLAWFWHVRAHSDTVLACPGIGFRYRRRSSEEFRPWKRGGRM